MAKATRPDGKVPDGDLKAGMKIFHVTSATIVDSLGAYCTEGQEAALTEKHARVYHKRKAIQVGLPDFGKPENDELQALVATLQADRDALAAQLANVSAPAVKKEIPDALATTESADGKGAEASAAAGEAKGKTRA